MSAHVREEKPMSVMLIDRIAAVVLQNNVVRIDCVMSGPNQEERPAGTLLIPGNVAGPILQSLIKSMQELEKRLREQAASQKAAAPSGPQRLS
jgi:hypothetical protein